MGGLPRAQSLPPGREGETLLLLWWTEDCVKRRYAEFVGCLEELSRDNLDFLKVRGRGRHGCTRPAADSGARLAQHKSLLEGAHGSQLAYRTLASAHTPSPLRANPLPSLTRRPQEKSMRVMSELLTAKPEAEARLLAGLVNKLGDPARKVASKAVWLLMQLLASHPVMKPVVVREVRRGATGGRGGGAREGRGPAGRGHGVGCDGRARRAGGGLQPRYNVHAVACPCAEW